MSIVIGVSGASGSVYARRLAEVLIRAGRTCDLVVSRAGRAVVQHELEEDPARWPVDLTGPGTLSLWADDDLFAPFCSGSHPPEAMVVVPCSMGTLGRIASGHSDSLLTRGADVCLKEKIPLLLVVRETPLSLIHIDNMRRAAEAGATIMPASPGFYHHPADIGGLVDHVVGKIMDGLKIEHTLFKRWRNEL